MRWDSVERRMAMADQLDDEANKAEDTLATIVREIQALAVEAKEIEAEIADRNGSRELDARLRDINDDLDYWCMYAEDAYVEAQLAREAATAANQNFTARELYG